MQLDNKHTALAFGSFMGIFHLVWAVLVALGWAKPFMDFILDIHHLNFVYDVQAFNLTKALTLVVVTFVIGYIFGWVFSIGWNMCRRKR